jgi:hypothetical protein
VQDVAAATTGTPPSASATRSACAVADMASSSRSGAGPPDVDAEGQREVGVEVPLVALVEHDGAGPGSSASA